jgi:hypothetical protein
MSILGALFKSRPVDSLKVVSKSYLRNISEPSSQRQVHIISVGLSTRILDVVQDGGESLPRLLERTVTSLTFTTADAAMLSKNGNDLKHLPGAPGHYQSRFTPIRNVMILTLRNQETFPRRTRTTANASAPAVSIQASICEGYSCHRCSGIYWGLDGSKDGTGFLLAQ